MRHTTLLAALCLAVPVSANTVRHPIDSLRTVLSETVGPESQIPIYRNLADLTFETAGSCGYLIRLAEKAKQCGRTETMLEAYSELSITYMLLEKLDSARYYVAQLRKEAPAKQRDMWVCYPEMRLFNAELISDEASDAVEQKIGEMKGRDISEESIYSQISLEYCLGQALYNKENFQEAFPYMLKAYELAGQLPPQERSKYKQFIIRRMSSLYNALSQNEKAVAVLKEGLAICEQNYALDIKGRRPYYPIDDDYCDYYSSLMINVRLLPAEEVRDYLHKLTEVARVTADPTRKYNCYLAINNYHLAKKEWPESLASNDSLILYAGSVARYNLPGLHQINALIHAELDQYEEAFGEMCVSYRLQDSIRQNDMQDQLNKMRVEYDVNRLNYENSQLEIRNKHILIVCLTLVLLSALVLCTYLYIHLKREQETKKRIQQLQLRAEEGEKLKTAFINSICHEIRTPLNGIVGFAGLMFDTSIDEEERATFHDEIRQSTDQLVSLVDSMLEVANLDISDEKLPCSPVDICALCNAVSARYAAANAASGIKGTAACTDGELTIPTHERYLTLVIGHLLDNAYKFTRQGHIALTCSREGNNAVISVEDTGCGIPAESRGMVFDRFTKLDTYKQGSGLGLYLCKTIVRRLSGQIYIDPDYTYGTRVVVLLPLA